jgi:hypothetical protein
MVASPNSSRLPPRGQKDLGKPESTRQNRQSEKRLSFLAKQIRKTAKSCFLQNKYITYYVQNITLHQKEKRRSYSYFSGAPEGSLLLAGPGRRSMWDTTMSAASCTPSRAAAAVARTGPTRIGVSGMAGSWL